MKIYFSSHIQMTVKFYSLFKEIPLKYSLITFLWLEELQLMELNSSQLSTFHQVFVML